MRVPHAVLIALAIAVFDLLPVLATGGILIPWGAVMAVRGDLKMAAGMLILYLVTTAVRNILEPGLVGKADRAASSGSPYRHVYRTKAVLTGRG